jgi:outer membrane lipoprotein carrier protein
MSRVSKHSRATATSAAATIVCLSFGWLAGSAQALAAGAAANAAASAEVEKYLAGLSSWSADFEQTIDDGHGKVARTAAGKFYLQRPGHFRWDYSQPSEQLVLADGKQIWFYDKDLGQANVRNMDATLANTPAMLLSGGGSIGSQFDITALPANGGLKWYQLIPKQSNTDFQLIRIGFDKDGELASMFLADKLNQVTQLVFTHATRNAKFPPDLFSFTPPPGVDVIGHDGK